MTARAPLRLMALLAGVMIVAPWLAPYGPGQRFPDHLHAPPMRAHLDGGGIYFVPLAVADRLAQRFEEIAGERMAGPWSSGAPVFLLGADALGRDVLSRTLYGARTSLGLALAATLGALVLGGLLGAWAGMAGGRVDFAVGKAGDVLLVLPLVYAVVALRAALPLVLPLEVVLITLAVILVLLGWPRVARGVRAIVRVEARQEHVVAATALGASRWWIMTRHLLPACTGFLAVQAALLIPTFVLAEAALSYVGLGFPDGVPSWGTALTDAATITAMTQAPWTLAPAVAIFAVVLATNLLLEPATDDPLGGASRAG